MQVQKFRELAKEKLLDYPWRFDFEHHLDETLIKFDQFFQKLFHQNLMKQRNAQKKLMEQNQILQDELEESKYMKYGYEFNFKFSDYDKVLVHYSDYLPIDKIKLKVQQNNQTVQILLDNYEKQIELKLLNLSQLINLKFAYRETSKKSIFVQGLSKVGKLTLLNILKWPQCLEIKVENQLKDQGDFIDNVNNSKNFSIQIIVQKNKKELNYKIKEQLNFEYNHYYYQNLSNQFIKLIEILRSHKLKQFKMCNFSNQLTYSLFQIFHLKKRLSIYVNNGIFSQIFNFRVLMNLCEKLNVKINFEIFEYL